MFRGEHHSTQLSVGHHLNSEYLRSVAKARGTHCNLPAQGGLSGLGLCQRQQVPGRCVPLAGTRPAEGRAKPALER